MALTADRNTVRRESKKYVGKLAASAVVFLGALACRNATGFVVPGSASTTLKALGRANEAVSNVGGADGDKTVEYEKGTFKFKNSASGDLITIADVENDCYIVDDETVAKTNGTNTRSIAGRIKAVEADGVWVEIS